VKVVAGRPRQCHATRTLRGLSTCKFREASSFNLPMIAVLSYSFVTSRPHFYKGSCCTVISYNLCVCVFVCVALAPDSCVKNSIWKIAAFGNPCFERVCSPACKFLNGMEFLFSWRQWNDYIKDRPPRHRFFLLSLCVWVNAEMVLGSCDRTSWGKCEERGKSQQDARIRCVLLSSVSQPHNRYQPHPAEPAQYTVCSNTVFVLLKMGIMMPETCWDRS
jgi:hypothetical protein